MANSLSARKRARQTERCSERNRRVKILYKSLRKKVEGAVASGDKKGAEEQYRLFTSAVDRAAKNNVIHKNAAARYKSALGRKMA